MSEIINDKRVFSLLDIANSLRSIIAKNYVKSYWIKAEMNKLNFYKHSGHCYPELVEKKDGKVIAQMRATLWKTDYQRINQLFMQQLKEPLRDGIKILFRAGIEFSPVHGLSLVIEDIDPSFTLGDLEREKQETIQKLAALNIFGKNKSLKLPLLPQRIAIISVETSKGLADFLSVLDHNVWGYKFFHMLFPSLLQGEKAVSDIVRQLQNIRKVAHHFDVVVIVRGGGGDIGLTCYNHFDLCKEIAEYPLPVLTGIGHATNETVAEMISHYNAITPTKLADFFVQTFHNFAVPVQKAQEFLVNTSRVLLEDAKADFHGEIKVFKSATRHLLQESNSSVKHISSSLVHQTHRLVAFQKHSLNTNRDDMRNFSIHYMLNEKRHIDAMVSSLGKDAKLLLRNQQQITDAIRLNVENMSPEKVLKRGYSITLVNGKEVKDASSLSEGDVLETRLSKGIVTSVVKSKQNNKNE
jgi:exodeoxyribonuclease VII large subunit